MTLPVPVVATVVPSLGDHAAEWDDLAATGPLPSPFLRSWWVDATSPGTACHLLFHDDRGVLVGGLPLMREDRLGVGRIRFAGAGVLCPDHLDLVAREEAVEAVGGALMKWLTTSRHLIVDLAGLVQDSRLEQALGRPAQVIDVAPFTRLRADADDYLATRSSGTRRSVRRSDRRLEAAGAQHRRVSPDGLRGALDDFRRLQETRPGRAPLLAELPTLGRALAAGMAAGQARVDVLETAGRAQAVSMAFVVGDRISLYQIARSLDPEDDGAGTVLLHRVVADAVRAGCREVDLLRGDEDYKSSLADDQRTLGRIRFARGPVAGAALGARNAAAHLRRRVVR